MKENRAAAVAATAASFAVVLSCSVFLDSYYHFLFFHVRLCLCADCMCLPFLHACNIMIRVGLCVRAVRLAHSACCMPDVVKKVDLQAQIAQQNVTAFMT